ncbi:RNA methyltransferase [Flavobacterium sp. HSC-61S13]|uniref:TrmH family RNA methyltransferase n=1 Tax=Flavobacterium sp. HSC-61S13 TaxID=2910963 RepID=UPI0020A0F953|nr:RNA methyltransferase [Flavobacterium sp. HSC-61S13]MCP1997101.1 tRNA (guanosine-2'-O-)-methyltransferase [Flavobacterium sp. HSC-61S13]
MISTNKLFQNIDYLNYLEDFITENRKAGFIEVLKNRTKHFTIVTEDLFQLHNTSAVMRSCEVFGLQDLHVIEENMGKTIDKEIAMGAEKWVDIHRHNSSQNCIDHLRSKGYQIVATTPHADSSLLENFDISKPAALFFGTERSGLSDEIINQADSYIKIPMVGFTESLNISVSAAIVIQDITTRLRNSEIEWKLTAEELLEKRIDWARKTIKDIDNITDRFIQLQGL